MKVNLPNWLWALILIDAAAVVLLIGSKFGGWVLPGWMGLLAGVVPTLVPLAFAFWAYKPGGVWDQYEAGRKEKTQEKM